MAGSQIYGGQSRLAALTSLYPKLVTKEKLLSSTELEPFMNFSSQVIALLLLLLLLLLSSLSVISVTCILPQSHNERPHFPFFMSQNECHCSVVKALTILFPMLPLTIKLKEIKWVTVHSSIVKAYNKGNCETTIKVTFVH